MPTNKVTKTSKTKEGKPHLLVYAIERKGSDAEKKDNFILCGVAFSNQDGSLNILLHKAPYGSELHVRAPKGEKPCWKAIPGAIYKVFQLPQGKEEVGPKWQHIGVARGNKDQSLNIKLNLIPTGRLNIRLHRKEVE